VFERFTDRARRVVVLAQSEARLLNHNYIGTEHILLGLLHEGEGLAAQALEKLDVPLEKVRQQVEEIIGKGLEPPTGHIPFTPRAKKVLELALREALQLGHNYIGTEHLLLGLIREGDGVGAQVLQKMGAELNRVRVAVVDLLSGYTEAEVGAAEAVTKSSTKSAKEGPLCPRCDAQLRETAVYRVLEVPAHLTEGDLLAVTVVFCDRCGTSLGTLA
jgi:ATP-dependent Clp protease ATP-binding subunit ClpC